MPNQQSPLWNVPHPRNRFFTGRAQVLNDLRRELQADGKTALSGMAGIGKTQAAAEYAYRHRSEYRAVLWVNADSGDSLRSDFTAIAVMLNLPEKDEADSDKIVSAVKRWLEVNAGWLLILDNADDLSLVSDLLRREWGGHLLLTTRAHATGSISSVEIREMEPEEGTLFLLRRAKLIAVDGPLGSEEEADRKPADEIVREVGGHPLALDQAGAFIEEKPSSTAEYLELYRREGSKLRAERGGVISDHESVTITFALAFQQVERVSAVAADMLRACAFLASYSIPEEIFIGGAAALGENLAAVVGGGVNFVKTVGEAGRFSLIRRHTKSGTFEIHRLVQQVLKDEMDAETQRVWAERVVYAVNVAFPSVEPNAWPLCEKLLPHGQEAARLIEEYGFVSPEAARLVNQVGVYCDEHAQYAKAEPLLVQALGIYEKALGPNHPYVATSLSNLARHYDRVGRYHQAEQLLVKALGIREKALEPDHPDLAASLNNLAFLYSRQGRYTAAEPLFARALSVTEKAYGREHPVVAVSLNNLAHLYMEQGKYVESESLHARALSIREKMLGPNHLVVAASLNNLAALYRIQGRYAEAGPLLIRALGIHEETLGPDHPDVATCLSNLGELYNVEGRYAEAEPLLTRALGINEKALGPDHPNLAKSLTNLGTFHNAQGRYAEAEPLFMRALGIQEKALGPDHPDLATIFNNLAALLSAQGKYTEAEPLLVRALSIYEKAYGPDHPSTSLGRRNFNELQRLMRAQTES